MALLLIISAKLRHDQALGYYFLTSVDLFSLRHAYIYWLMFDDYPIR